MAHPSMERLLTCAAEAQKRPLTYGDLGKLMKVTAARLTNWKTRGLSKQGAIAAEALFGCPSSWLLTGEAPKEPAKTVDFNERKPSPSEWSTLEDIKVLPHEEQVELRRSIRERAEMFRAYKDQVIAEAKAKAQ